jgi:indole-3-glycerol phosphate synthase
MGFLSDVTAKTRSDLRASPPDAGVLMARCLLMRPPLDFRAALEAGPLSVIAEVKRASPSAGVIAAQIDPVAQAKSYEAGGAAAISVLTERSYFHGSLLDLQAIRLEVGVPLLRKDFLVDPVQVIEARAHGADAVLLIVASLDDDELAAMMATAVDLRLGVLVESHSDADLRRALATDAPVIGVNARDLETLHVDFDAALKRLATIPGDRVAVLESGVNTTERARAAVKAGASAILVGEALMRAQHPADLIRTLRGGER